MLIAGFHHVHAARKIGGYDLAARFVEDWFLNAGIDRAESFPIPKSCVKWRYVAVADSNRLQRNLGLLGVQDVLAHDLSTECWEIMSLKVALANE
jgi:hypothetical protein